MAKFTIDDTVEKILKAYIGRKGILEQANSLVDQRSLNIGLQTTDQAGRTILDTQEEKCVNAQRLLEEAKDNAEQYNKADVYEAAKDKYQSIIKEELQPLFYIDMLSDGFIPKDATDEVKEAANAANAFKELREALLSKNKDYAQIDSIVRQYLGADINRICYDQRSRQGDFTGILGATADIMEAQARKIKKALAGDKDGKKYLQEAVEKGITEKKGYALASATLAKYAEKSKEH